jgi:NADPH-dependent 2,4-dienoyl-CoA reductase/sulfur reductase-like enzyme
MGTDLLLGTAVTGIVGGERARGVRLADGRQVDGDLVVLALGVVPADDWLAGTPVVRDHGVVVDQFLRAAPDVLAAGDVARVFSPRYGRHLRVEHWTTALGHGDLAAAVALGGTSGAPQQELPYVWTEQFDTRICVLGRTTPSATVVEQHPDADRFVVAYTDPAGRVQGALTWNWTRRLASWRPWITAGTHLAEVG